MGTALVAGTRRWRFGLTRRGRAVLTTAVAMGCTARLLGLIELYVLAAGAAGLVMAAMAYVMVRDVNLEITRSLNPTRIHAGDVTRVALRVKNRSNRPSPLVAITDPLRPSGTAARSAAPAGAAKFVIEPVASGHAEGAEYRLPADHRGVFGIGPLTGDVLDPFGLARRRITLASLSELVIYPAVEPLQARADRRGRISDADAPRASLRSPAGGEFAGLRAYRQGDDLRRVHWPSTARTGQIMIRQHEVAGQGRVTVGIDASPLSHPDPAVFEAVVSAGASLLVAEATRGSSVRLVTATDAGPDFDTGFGAGLAHLDLALDWLARLDAGADRGHSSAHHRDGPQRSARDRGATGEPRASVVLVGTDQSTDGWHGLLQLADDVASVTAVVFGAESAGGAPGPTPVVRIGPGRRFAPAWDGAQGAVDLGSRPVATASVADR